MAHHKSKKVWYCHQIQNNIMASYCKNECPFTSFNGIECPMGNLFNSCKLVSENNKKDIDKALK